MSQSNIQEVQENSKQTENQESQGVQSQQIEIPNQDQEQDQKQNQENKNQELKSKLFAKSEWNFQLKKKGGQTQNFPFKRWGHTAVIHQKSMYVYGGNGSHITHSKQQKNWEALYRFDCELNEWEKIHPQQTVKPAVRDSHAVCKIGDLMYMFGGSTVDEDIFSDLWTFNFNTYQWAEVKQSGEIPCNREGHTLIALNDQFLFLAGGMDIEKEQVYNDFYIYDIQNTMWKKIEPVGDEMVQREAQSAILINENIYLFGGQTVGEQNKYYNDLYVISVHSLLKKNASTFFLKKVELTTDVLPQPRASHTVCAYKNRFLIVIGGEGCIPGNPENRSSAKSSPNKKIKQNDEPQSTENDKIIEEEDAEKDQKSNTQISPELEEKQKKQQEDDDQKNVVSTEDNVYIFDTEMRCWQELDAPRAKGVGNPFPRFCHTACVYQNNVIIFGGLLTTDIKSDDILKLKLQDEGEEDEFVNVSNQPNIQSQQTLTNLPKNTNNICQNCNLVLGITDWVSLKTTTKQQAASEIQNNSNQAQIELESIINNDTKNNKQMQNLEFQKEEAILREELMKQQENKYKIGSSNVTIAFISQVLNQIAYPFAGFGLIVDAFKLLKTQNLNINLFIANRKDIKLQTNFNYGTFLQKEITDSILKDHNQKLYFQVFDDTEAFNQEQFYKILYQFGDISSNVDIQMDEDDQNFTDDEKWDNYSSLVKMGSLRIGDTLLIVSKDKKTGILRVGYLSTLPQNNPNVNDMISFMFFYDTNDSKYNKDNQDDRYLSQNGKLHKDLIVNNIRDYMSEDQLLKNHENGNYFYIFNLKRIPKEGNMLDYEFQYNSKLHDLQIKKSGYAKFQRKELIQNLVDFSFKQYLTLLYIDQKQHQELSIFFNNKPIEMKNYRNQLEKLQKDGHLQKVEVSKNLAQIRECGKIVLYKPKEFIKSEFEKQQNQKIEEDKNQEEVVKEEEGLEQKQQNAKKSQDITKNQEDEIKQEEENQNNQDKIEIEKKPQENDESEIQEVKNSEQQEILNIPKQSGTDEDDEIEVEVIVDTEEDKAKQNQNKDLIVQSEIEMHQQGILLYYKKRLIGRAETQEFGQYFVQKIMRKSSKKINKDQSYSLRYSGLVELNEFLKPNLFQCGIQNQFFSNILYTAFKSLIRLTKEHDRQQIQQQLFIQFQNNNNENINKEQQNNKNNNEQIKQLKEQLQKKQEDIEGINEKYEKLKVQIEQQQDQNLKKEEESQQTKNDEIQLQQEKKIAEMEEQIKILKKQLEEQNQYQEKVEKVNGNQQVQNSQNDENCKVQNNKIIDIESDSDTQNKDQTKQQEKVQQSHVQQNDDILDKQSQQIKEISQNIGQIDSSDDEKSSQKLKKESKQRQQEILEGNDEEPQTSKKVKSD